MLHLNPGFRAGRAALSLLSNWREAFTSLLPPLNGVSVLGRSSTVPARAAGCRRNQPLGAHVGHTNDHLELGHLFSDSGFDLARACRRQLIICKKIVRRLGPEIWARSQTGKGTAFFQPLKVPDWRSRSDLPLSYSAKELQDCSREPLPLASKRQLRAHHENGLARGIRSSNAWQFPSAPRSGSRSLHSDHSRNCDYHTLSSGVKH